MSHKEDFQRLNTSYDAIIVDDANFIDFNNAQKLSLLDNTIEQTIRVLYQTVTKKKGLL